IIISNISSLIPIKLNGSNFLLWKSLFEPILRAHKLMHYVEVSNVPHSPTDPTYALWYEKDQMLLSWINATLSESALPYIVGVQSSKAAWNILHRHYASSTPSHIMALKQQLHSFKKGSQSMQLYLQQFKTIANQLAACGSPISDDDLVLFVLDGLSPTY
ncbi:UBN2_3 domain-containing protein, partial [Cephalotus follicularis]